MDESGQIFEEFPFTNNWDGIQALVEKTSLQKAVVESKGNLWLRIYKALEENGIEVKLANPAKMKAIASDSQTPSIPVSAPTRSWSIGFTTRINSS